MNDRVNSDSSSTLNTFFLPTLRLFPFFICRFNVDIGTPYLFSNFLIEVPACWRSYNACLNAVSVQ